MLVKNIHFDVWRDNEAVSQTGWINLAEAYEHHTIPSVIDETDVAYNDIEDPSSILGKPSDVFEAVRMQSYINETGKKESTGESSVATA